MVGSWIDDGWLYEIDWGIGGVRGGCGRCCRCTLVVSE